MITCDRCEENIYRGRYLELATQMKGGPDRTPFDEECYVYELCSGCELDFSRFLDQIRARKQQERVKAAKELKEKP